jgi:hypothetical protein
VLLQEVRLQPLLLEALFPACRFWKGYLRIKLQSSIHLHPVECPSSTALSFHRDDEDDVGIDIDNDDDNDGEGNGEDDGDEVNINDAICVVNKSKYSGICENAYG